MILAQLVNKLSAFYGTRNSIKVFTRTCHWNLSWASWSHSIYSHLILTVSLHLGPGVVARFICTLHTSHIGWPHFSKENPGDALKTGWTGINVSREKGHIYTLKSDHTYSVKLRTRNVTGWCSGDALYSYSRGVRLESLPGQREFRCFLQSLQANSRIMSPLARDCRFLLNPFKYIIH